MKELIILGKAPIKYKVSELKTSTNEIWMMGTDDRKGGDVYFELHGINVKHPNTIYSLPDQVYELDLPINNSICALLVHAYLLGYTNISIIGAPMEATHEYLQQKPAVAYICGWLKAKGISVKWSYGPSNTNYGKCRK